MTLSVKILWRPWCSLVGHRWAFTMRTCEGNKLFVCRRCGKAYLAPLPYTGDS